MKRFIDLRHHYNDIYANFTWWDTVTLSFEIHGGASAWETWEEFEGYYEGKELERYRGLCPEWVFELKEEPLC